MVKKKSQSTSRPKKRTSSSPRMRSPVKSQRQSSWKLLFLGITLGFVAAVGLYIYQHRQTVTHSLNQYLNHNKPTVVTKKVTTEKQPPMPRFSFYTLLPNQKVKTSDSYLAEQAKQQVQRQDQAAIKESPSKEQFFLQVASFRAATDADRLKAELTLLGFNVDVTKGLANNETWFRVLVGPYQTKNTAETDQKRLLANKIKSLIRHFPT